MGRRPCCDKNNLKRGPWTPEEDDILINFISTNGHGNWRNLPKLSGLRRCGKSCRLRWANYLRPDIKRGPFTSDEQNLVVQLHGVLGNKWAAIAAQLPGRTDNEIKNLWNTCLKKQLMSHGPLLLHGANKIRAPATYTTGDLVQWESAGLEAEPKLSNDSMIVSSGQAPIRKEPDYFLLMWNSEVGESFRKLPGGAGNGTVAESVASRASSSSCVRNEPDSPAMGTKQACASRWNLNNGGHKFEPEISSSTEFESSLDTALQMLLDFPIDNDMSFLEGTVFGKAPCLPS